MLEYFKMKAAFCLVVLTTFLKVCLLKIVIYTSEMLSIKPYLTCKIIFIYFTLFIKSSNSNQLRSMKLSHHVGFRISIQAIHISKIFPIRYEPCDTSTFLLQQKALFVKWTTSYLTSELQSFIVSSELLSFCWQGLAQNIFSLCVCFFLFISSTRTYDETDSGG